MDEKIEGLDTSLGEELLKPTKIYVKEILALLEKIEINGLSPVSYTHLNVKIIASEKAILFMRQFGYHVDDRYIEVKEGDSISFGKHEFTFVEAPMVHWPEVLMTYDLTDKVLFSADAFGSFKSNEDVYKRQE